MSRPLFTDDEITLCTYATLYDATDFGGKRLICTLTGRPLTSVNMKIRNFAAMLDAKGIQRSAATSVLTGRTTGEQARDTNWNSVARLIQLERDQLLLKCNTILAEARKRSS